MRGQVFDSPPVYSTSAMLKPVKRARILAIARGLLQSVVRATRWLQTIT